MFDDEALHRLFEVTGDLQPTRRDKRLQRLSNLNRQDLQVVAPYLWERRARQRKKQLSKIATNSFGFELNEFSLDLAYIGELPQRLHRTANMLRQLTDSNGVKLYLVDKIYNEIYFCPNEENVSSHRTSWSIRTGRTIAAHVAFAREYVLANDLFADDRFPEGTGWGDATLTSVICVPMLTLHDECSAVIELFRDNGVDYVERDLDTVLVVSGWMGTAIEQHQKLIVAKRQEDINSKLMVLMHEFMSNVDLFDDVINQILVAAKSSISAQRGSFYILNRRSKELETYVYDDALSESGNTVFTKILRKKIKGIAQMAVDTGQLVNISDAYTDPRFDPAIDQRSGFLTRSVLCMPLLDKDGCTGVIQIINKLPTGTFSATDEHMFRIFGAYSANIVNYKNQFDARLRAESMTAVYNDIVMNRLRFRLVVKPQPIPEPNVMPPVPANFLSYTWYPECDNRNRTFDLCYRMLSDVLGVNYLNAETTYAFLLALRKLYRDMSYHNFEHAFVFLHSIYCVLKRYADRFDQVEKLALMLGGLCHDVDHPGLTNTFLKLTNHPLSTLYDDSFLENHHIWLGQLVLKNSKIVHMLDAASMARFDTLFHDVILATDLKIHLIDNRAGLEAMCRIDPQTKRPNFNWQNEGNRRLLRGLMMTASDLAVQFKPFSVVEGVVGKLMEEFFAQGDQEKALGNQPMPAMDRSKVALLPEMQVQFLRIVALPCFDMMRKLLPATSEMIENCEKLKSAWMDIIDNRSEEIEHN